MSRPGKPLFTDLSVTVASGDRLAVVGINGSGKSTLLGVLAGVGRPRGGRRPPGSGRHGGHARPDGGAARRHRPRAVGGGWEAEAVLDRLGIGDLVDADVRSLSGGQAKRVALARALVAVGDGTEADLLILDEPTNHLDLDADRLAGGAAGRASRRPRPRHPRPPRARPGDDPHPRARPRPAHVHDGGYASTSTPGPSGPSARRRPSASGATWPGRAGVAAPGRRPAPASPRPTSPRPAVVDGRPPSHRAPTTYPWPTSCRCPARRHGGGAARTSATATATAAVRARRPAAGPGRAARRRGVNGSGKSTLLDLLAGRRQPRSGRRGRGSTVPVGYYDQRASTCRSTCGSARWSPAPPGSPTGPTPRCSSACGSTPTRSGRRSACCRAASGAGCSSPCVLRQGPERPAAGRADQRPRPRHAPGAGGPARCVARARWWW